MYSERLLTYFHSRAHGGKLANATHTGTAGTPGKGPSVQLWLRAEDGTIREARWKAWGCPAAMACCEALCERLEGELLSTAGEISEGDIITWLDGVPEGKEYCPKLTAQAAHALAEGDSLPGE